MEMQMEQAQPGRADAVRGERAGPGGGGVLPAEAAGGDALSAAARRANAGPHASSLAALQAVVAQRACADCDTVRRTMGGGAPVQRARSKGGEPVQRAAAEDGALPGELRAGLEHLSGLDLSGVSVNYDSPRPAQLNAHAVAQGPVIDVAPGQERHLPHEGWHAVQQMQNRVRPTMDLGGTPVNDDASLEREADVMGARALAAGRGAAQRHAAESPGARRQGGGAGATAQRVWNFDDATGEYSSTTELVGRRWKSRLVRIAEPQEALDDHEERKEEVQDGTERLVEQFRWETADDGSTWKTAEQFEAEDIHPPQGATFSRQRERGMGPGADAKYSYVPATDAAVPEQVVAVRKLIRTGLARIRARTDGDKAMLDALVAQEFAEIGPRVVDILDNPEENEALLRELLPRQRAGRRGQRPPPSVEQALGPDGLGSDGAEMLRAGLRYKRVYEHEQNLLTINRRARNEHEALLSQVEKDTGVEVSVQREAMEGGTVERVFATVEGVLYPVGVFYADNARFELQERPEGARHDVYRDVEGTRETDPQIEREIAREYGQGGREGDLGEGGAEVLALGGEENLALGGEENLALGGEENLALGGEENLALDGEEVLALGGAENLALGGAELLALDGEENLALGGEENLALGGAEVLPQGRAARNPEYVREKYGRFVRRYVKRAIRYEDVLALQAGQPMAPKKTEFDAGAVKKEADEFGIDEGAPLSHEQKVIGQIRGHGRFISATTSSRLATSTSRGTYDSPLGMVEIDLARMDQDHVNDAYTPGALKQIYGIDDLGSLEFIPKHVRGEEPRAKAGRDAYRARELVLQPPPHAAVGAELDPAARKGIIIVGITKDADEQKIRKAIPEAQRDLITFIEVNTRYKRVVNEQPKATTAFVFFKADTDVQPVIDQLMEGEPAPGIQPERVVFPTPQGWRIPQ